MIGYFGRSPVGPQYLFGRPSKTKERVVFRAGCDWAFLEALKVKFTVKQAFRSVVSFLPRRKGEAKVNASQRQRAQGKAPCLPSSARPRATRIRRILY